MLVFILLPLYCFINILLQNPIPVRTGIFSVDEFRVYAKLLNWRSKGDYNDFFDFSKEDVDSMMRPTKHFIDKVVALIEL